MITAVCTERSISEVALDSHTVHSFAYLQLRLYRTAAFQLDPSFATPYVDGDDVNDNHTRAVQKSSLRWMWGTQHILYAGKVRKTRRLMRSHKAAVHTDFCFVILRRLDDNKMRRQIHAYTVQAISAAER